VVAVIAIDAFTPRKSLLQLSGVFFGLVLGLIFLLGYLVRRFILPKVRLGGRDLEVLARTYVGNKQSVALVRAGRRVLVVGVTASRVNLLTCLDDSMEAAHLIGEAAARKENQAILDRSAAFLRGELGRRLRLRVVPQLQFVYDESVERGEYLDSLIESTMASDDSDHQDG